MTAVTLIYQLSWLVSLELNQFHTNSVCLKWHSLAHMPPPIPNIPFWFIHSNPKSNSIALHHSTFKTTHNRFTIIKVCKIFELYSLMEASLYYYLRNKQKCRKMSCLAMLEWEYNPGCVLLSRPATELNWVYSVNMHSVYSLCVLTCWHTNKPINQPRYKQNRW